MSDKLWYIVMVLAGVLLIWLSVRLYNSNQNKTYPGIFALARDMDRTIVMLGVAILAIGGVALGCAGVYLFFQGS
jgi:hypothetical protein